MIYTSVRYCMLHASMYIETIWCHVSRKAYLNFESLTVFRAISSTSFAKALRQVLVWDHDGTEDVEDTTVSSMFEGCW